MIDIDTHRIIDMIDSRETKDVALWLSKFPNISIVSRDGSITYRKAILDSHKSAIQVTDRFHLLQNLTKYCKDFLFKYLKPNVKVEIDSKNLDNNELYLNSLQTNELSLKERYEQALKLYESGENKSNVCQLSNIDIRIFNKISKLDLEKRELYFKTNSQILRDEKIAIKEAKINQVRELHKSGMSIRGICRELGHARETVRKYLNPDTTAVHGSYGIKRGDSKLDKYYNEIDKLLSQNIKFNDIEVYIRKSGYEGSSSLIRRYISNKKNESKMQGENNKNCNIYTEIVKRSLLLKLLYHPLKKVKSLKNDLLELVYNQYPKFKDLIDAVCRFRSILREKNFSKLEIWMDNISKYDIRELNSFITGLKLDLDAVML